MIMTQAQKAIKTEFVTRLADLVPMFLAWPPLDSARAFGLHSGYASTLGRLWVQREIDDGAAEQHSAKFERVFPLENASFEA